MLIRHGTSITEKHSQGFTLVELLVALALGLTLTGGIVNIYLQNKRNYLQDDEVARLQENARYAINLLKRELTMAGFIAGITDYSDISSAAVTTDCVASGNWALNLAYPIDVVNNATTGNALQPIFGDGTSTPITWNCVTSADVENGTDIVSVKRTADRYTAKDGTFNTGITAKDSNQIYLEAFDSNASFAWKYPGDTLQTTAGSNYDYWEYYSKIFFVRSYSKTSGDGIPTLCTSSLVADDMTTNCLVEGIEDLQVEFGIDSDDDSVPDIYKATPTQAELQEAVAVRVYLLVRSVNTLSDYTNNKAYALGSKAVAAKNDGYVRRVFSTTVQMRNAKLPNA